MKRLVVVVLGAAIVGLVVVVNFTGVFDVTGVQATGVDRPTQELMVAAADIAEGTPLARVNTSQVAESVQREVPGVSAVTVQRRWPHSIVIRATPRTVAANVTVDGTVRWADQNGFVFGAVNQPRKAVPSIIVRPRFSTDTAARQRAIAEALIVERALPAAVKAKLARIEFRSKDNIVIATTSGRTIRWGSAADSDRKAVVLTALLGRKAKVYDVSTPDLPTTKK
jgi:cell division protein FtsQ